MKMTKKIILAASALMALAFTGCDNSLSGLFQKKYGEKNVLSYTDATYESGMGKWTVDKTNETDGTIRAINLLTTDHTDIAAVATIAPSNTEQGVIGVIFNLEDIGDEKDEDGKKIGDILNFCVVGIQQDYYYISYFGNIRDSQLSENNFGAGTNVITDIEEAGEDPFEIEIIKYPESANFDKLEESGETQVVIDINEDEETGDYTVSLYGVEAWDADNHVLNDVNNLPYIKSRTINASEIGKDGPKQTRIGVYTNVYAESNLKASLEILDLTNNAIVVE